MSKTEVTMTDYDSSLEVQHFSKSVYNCFTKACSTEQSNISTLQCSISVVLNANNTTAQNLQAGLQ